MREFPLSVTLFRRKCFCVSLSHSASISGKANQTLTESEADSFRGELPVRYIRCLRLRLSSVSFRYFLCILFSPTCDIHNELLRAWPKYTLLTASLAEHQTFGNNNRKMQQVFFLHLERYIYRPLNLHKSSIFGSGYIEQDYM